MSILTPLQGTTLALLLKLTELISSNSNSVAKLLSQFHLHSDKMCTVVICLVILFCSLLS